MWKQATIGVLLAALLYQFTPASWFSYNGPLELNYNPKNTPLYDWSLSYGTSSDGKLKYVYRTNGLKYNRFNIFKREQARELIGKSLERSERVYLQDGRESIKCTELTYNTLWIGFCLIGPNIEWPNYDFVCGDNNSGLYDVIDDELEGADQFTSIGDQVKSMF